MDGAAFLLSIWSRTVWCASPRGSGTCFGFITTSPPNSAHSFKLNRSGSVARANTSPRYRKHSYFQERNRARHHKHDKRDAFALARLLRLNEFKPVWQPTEDQRVLFKRIAKSYENAVQRQTRLKLQLKSLFQHWDLFPAGATIYSKPGRVTWLRQLPFDTLRSQALLLYELLDQALAGQSQFRRLMCQTGRQFPEIQRLSTTPGVGLVGSHLFVAYVQDPARFPKFSRLSRYCRLGIRDRSSDDKPLGYQQLDRQGIGTLKAIGYRAYLQAAKRRAGPVWDFYQLSLRRTGSTTHARLNTQRKILLTLWTLWLTGREFDPNQFSRAQPIDV